jgi:integrase
MAAGTFNKHIRLLMLVFRILKQKAGLSANPWENISRKRNIPKGRRELTSEELAAVIQPATGEMRILFALGTYTGLRLGDCCTLRWSEVDLARGLIMRVPRKTARTSAKPVHIPIHPQLAMVLREYREHNATGRRRLPNRTDDSGVDYVLPEIANNYKSNPSWLTVRIRKHFESCGIQTHQPDTGYIIKKNAKGKKRKISTGKRAVVEVGFHSFRHSFVSLCREANAPLAVVEAIVGHSNPAMTRHYTHVGELAATQAVAALPALLVPPQPGKGGITLGSETADKKTSQGTESSDPMKEIMQIVSTMTPKTCQNDKRRLLELLKQHRAVAVQD